MKRQRLVLVGGGHAHLEVVRSLRARELDTVLLSDNPLGLYSGMVPGVLAGHFRFSQAQVDLGALCRRSGVKWRQGSVVAIDPERRCLTLASGESLVYDLLSLDVGCASSVHDMVIDPGVMVWKTRPATELISKWPVPRCHWAVVGGGVAGVELALALQHRWSNASLNGYLVCGNGLLPEMTNAVRQCVRQRLQMKGIHLLEQQYCVRCDLDGVTLSDSSRLSVGFTMLATPAVAHAWLKDSILADSDGFVPVSGELEVSGFPGHFAVGDCARFTPPLPKAGVFPVRQAPVLMQNLRAKAAGKPLQPYHPQSRFLNLISLGDRSAIAVRSRWWLRGRWVWYWKRWIDLGFVRRYQ